MDVEFDSPFLTKICMPSRTALSQKVAAVIPTVTFFQKAAMPLQALVINKNCVSANDHRGRGQLK